MKQNKVKDDDENTKKKCHKKKKHSKFNAKKREVDGIVFDSTMESKYYEVLKDKLKSGKIKGFKLQPKFNLQPGYTKNGKKIQPISYSADFSVEENDGTTSIIDTKGMETPSFKLKKKIFEYLYKDLTLIIIKYHKGVFMVDEEFRKVKKAEDKIRAEKKAEKERKSCK